ncbi:MAG: hypothetical protein GX754_02450 [Clostridiaceae bacterium]|nr:hypothetical protein [Clostridiaceae bacterium]
MAYNFNITGEEKAYLRDLAAKCMEYANLPIMKEREMLWCKHNSLQGERPVIVVEMNTFEQEMLPGFRCQSSHARAIEGQLIRHIVNFEMINDDKVIPPYFSVDWRIYYKPFGMDFVVEHAVDSAGRRIGYKRHYPVSDLKNDMHLVGPSVYSIDREYTMAWKSFVEEVLDGIMPVRVTNSSLRWSVTPSSKAFTLLGMENMLFSIVDYPDEMHKLMRFIVDDLKGFIKWQEEEGLLVLNNGNDYVGAGSYGFTDELPTDECKRTGKVTTKDLWLNMNSQETVGLSPQTFGEFIFPYYAELAKEFGLVYYGCCEPVHGIWKDYLSKLPGLRKISVSPWCDENYMGEVLKGSNVIYSRKPSPNYIGVGSNFDKEAYAGHMANTLRAAQGCSLEFIFRDIYTVSGDRSKPGKAVKILRELIDKMW